MEFKDKIAVITGGAQGIGKCVAEEFEKAGARCAVIDIREGGHYVGDIGKKEVLEDFAAQVIGRYGHVDYLINNAPPMMKGLDECGYEDFQYALSVGVTAPFYLSKLLAPHFAPGGSIVNTSSSRDRMSQHLLYAGHAQALLPGAVGDAEGWKICHTVPCGSGGPQRFRPDLPGSAAVEECGLT